MEARDRREMDRDTAVSLLVAGAVGVGVLFWLYRAEQHRMATVQAAAELQKRQQAAVESKEACALRAALEGFYAKHAPEKVATVEDLLARVYGGKPTSINGVRVGGVLWTAKELCEKVEAKYGDKVPVTFKPDGSVDAGQGP